MTDSTLYEAIQKSDKPYLVAEIGLNHNGDFDLALKCIEAAARSGAHAVKFQTIDARKLVAPAPEKHGGILNDPVKFFDSFRLSGDQYRQLRQQAHSLNLHFFSTPFDEASADFLVDTGVDAMKISSGDITHIPLIEYLAALKKTLIISTGMATMQEVEQAVTAAQNKGCPGIILLHCAFCHPAELGDLNLRAMQAMMEKFSWPVGLSDHTPGCFAPVIATSLGARMIEKHFTVDRQLPGPDQQYSMEPAEFAEMQRLCNDAVLALGTDTKKPVKNEKNLLILARRSVHAIRDIRKGEEFNQENTAILRPAEGLEPARYVEIIGKTASADISSGTPINTGHIK